MTKEEILMLKDAIESHINLLYKYESEYQKVGDTESVKDCLREILKYQNLQNKLKDYEKD